MAYDFDGATNYLSKASVGNFMLDYPISMFLRLNPEGFAASAVGLCYILESASYNHYALYKYATTSSASLSVFNIAAIPGDNNALAVGTWAAVGGASSASNAHAIYVDADKNTSTASKAFQLATAVQIAARNVSGVWQTFLDGKVASAAIWAAALSDAEFISLYKGFSPRRIRPQSLKFYAPLVRDLSIIQGAGLGSLTNTNAAAVSPHPRTYGI